MQRSSLQSQTSKVSKISQTTSATKIQCNSPKEQVAQKPLDCNAFKRKISLPDNLLRKLSDSEERIALKLKKQSQDYCSLLIQQSQLDLELIEQEKMKNILQNKILSNRKQTTQLKQQIQKFKSDLNKKSQHILKYQQYLKGRFKEHRPWRTASYSSLSIKREALFEKTKKNNHSKMEQHKMGPYSLDFEVKKQKEVLNALRSEFQTNQQNAMRKLLQQQRLKVNRFRKESIQRIKMEFKKLEKEKQMLLKNRSEYVTLNQNLQFLLTVQEEHENSCIIIQRAMILKENQKVMNHTYQLETSNEIQTNLMPNLKIMLDQALKTRQGLQVKMKKLQQTLSDYGAILESRIAIFGKFNQ